MVTFATLMRIYSIFSVG